jgi:signal transduction histidine kinase
MISHNQSANNSSPVKNKLLKGLGFELRTLLNGFAGPLHLLKHRVNDPDLVDIFRLLDSSLSRLERLSIRSIMVSKIDNEKFIINKIPVNVVDIARYSILELQPISEFENVKLKTDSELPEMMILGDYDSLKQVFEILLETAISLSEENSLVEINFLEGPTSVECTIDPQSATLPLDLSLNLEQMGQSEDTSWDLLMVKKLLTLNDAEIRIIEENSNRASSIEILFKKHLE